jgi:hypothetical protein
MSDSNRTTSTSAQGTEPGVEPFDSYEVDVDETEGSVDANAAHPVEPFRLARVTAAKNLSAQLQQKHGMSVEAADAIAYALEDPAEARRQLQFPNRVRVPGGTLRTITGRVSAYSVVPHLVNGRVVGATPYPASVFAGLAPPKFWAERDLTTATTGTAELILNGKTRQEVVDAFEIASRELLAQNDLTKTIRENGIFFPITVVPLHVETKGDVGGTTLTAVEGSSRTVASHRILGIESSDPLYGSVANFRTARGRMQDVMAKLALPMSDVTDDELEQARAASLPAVVVISYEPDGDGGADLLDALDAYVAFLHLDPPKPWTEPAKENKLADGVVDELVAVNELESEEAAWYAGMVAPTESPALRLPTAADERGARILRKLTSSAATPAGKAVGRGIKRYTLQKRASKNPKALAAASLALRAHSSARKKAVTAILGRTWEHRAFWQAKWDATIRTPEELREAAILEVGDGRTTPGPATLELAARGTYYLVTSGALATEEPGSYVGQRPSDKRTPARVLDALMRSSQGIHLLYQAVVTGRLGAPPPRVDERGAIVVSAAGTLIEANNAWIRDTFGGSRLTTTAPASTVTPTMTPEHLLDTTLDALEADLDALVATLRAAESIEGASGGSLIATVGLDSPRARDFREKLEDVDRALTRYELIWQMRNGDLAETADDESEES